MRRELRLALGSLLLMCASACESAGQSELRIHVVDPRGRSAAAGILEGTISVEVTQGDTALSCGGGACEAPIRSGDFDLALPILSLREPTTARARIIGGEADELLGAVPGFQIFGTGIDMGLLPVTLVMAPPSTCRRLELPGVTSDGEPRLSRPRRDAAAVVRQDGVVLVVGGVEAEGEPSSRVDRYDQVIVEMLPTLEPTGDAVGAARGVALSDDVSLVVGDGSAWLFVPRMGPPAAMAIGLHAGAGSSSALVDLADRGAAILGGAGPGGEPVEQITWITQAGFSAGTASLASPRRRPVAAVLDGGVLVLGGAAAGEPVAEWVEFGGGGRALEAPSAELLQGRGGWLAVSPNGRAALWGGARDAEGQVGPRTFLLRGCPDACEVEAGPPWAEPRMDVATAPAADGDLWLVGGRGGEGPSATTERVTWEGETPRFVEGPTLEVARAGAVAFEHAFGIVTAIGGEGPDGLRADVEHCTPAALAPR